MGDTSWAGIRTGVPKGSRVEFKAMGDKYATLQRAQLLLEFIHANSTTHSFLFGALAELLDNARDAGAARLDVFSVDNEKLQGGFMLCFLDDGCGMSPDEASDIIFFGTSKKRSSALKFIGQYGNGLKSGSMRIGKDFILFTKKEETMTCMFFSQTFCEREGLSEVVVPIPSWLMKTREPATDDLQKFSLELSIIYKYSPFKTEAELMKQFDVIYGKCGTLLVIYNLKLLLSGEPELDVKTDKEDILMAGVLEEKYQYVTSSFKAVCKNEVKKLEEAVKIAELKLRETQIQVNQSDKSSLSSPDKDALQKALEDVEAKHKILREKRRELKRARTLSLFYGVNIENRNQAGMFIYSNNRLIKMHEKVGPQLKLKSLLGAGVVGIVSIPLEIMEPSHNKQEFLNVQEYNHLLKVMGQYVVQYCKDTGISNRNLTLFWNEFGSQSNQDVEKTTDYIQYQRRQAMAIPFIIQCNLCLKWRILPSSADYPEKDLLEFWICANNPNPQENSCHQAERLPSIPVGTISTVLTSKNGKEKQLQESVQKYHNRLAEQQPQLLQFIPARAKDFTATCQTSVTKETIKGKKIRPPSKDLKRESLASCELLINHRGQRRNTEEMDSDIEYVSETNVTKSMKKKVKLQQQRHSATLPENIKLAGSPQACSWEMKRKESQACIQGRKTLTEVETSNGYPDIILVLNESNTDISLKQEKREDSLMKKETQELCSDMPEIKRNPSFSSWQSDLMENLNIPRHKSRVSQIGDCKAASSLTESSQCIPVTEQTVEKLMSNLRDILLYFFPEYQLPSEFSCTSVEELMASPKLEQCPEQTNKKLKICFNQIQNVWMAQYEKNLKRKMQSIIFDANRRGVVNEISLGQCEGRRKVTEDKLSALRGKLAVLLQKLHLGGPAGDLEEIDSYLEALLQEDNLLFQNTLNKK